MIKIVIAGTNGLAQLLAHFVESKTSNQFVIFSRRPVPGLSNKGWQVVVVDYANASDLRFKLAAAGARVRRFVPAEFGGPPALRPSDDILDNERRRALSRLAQLESTGMRFCVFTCGIFYDRFGPGGLAQSQLGGSSGIGAEGCYLMDYRRMVARLPYSNAEGRSAKVSMISVKDLAHFMVASLALSSWPREFRVRGDRMSVRELVAVAETVRGRGFDVQRYSRAALVAAEEQAKSDRNRSRELQLHHLITTAEGRWDFAEDNLSNQVNVEAEPFRTYLARIWSSTN